MKLTKGLTWPFLALALLTTIVFMAGLASLQKGCFSLGSLPEGAVGQGNSAPAPSAVFGMSDGSGNCSHVFRFWWFVFAFVFVSLIGLLITTATHMGLQFSRPFWVGMLTISILLMMMASEAFLGMEQMYKHSSADPSWWLSRVRVATAGAILSVISLIGLLMAVGTDWERTGNRNRRDDKMGGHTGLQGGHTGLRTTEHVPVQNVRAVDQV